MTRRRTTLKDVADATGVHSSTVSRALDPASRHLITPAVAARIEAAAQALGYRPNSIASSLRTRRSMTVGVVVPDITNPVFPPILRGIEDRLAADQYISIMVNSDSDGARESTLIDTLRARGVDGLILASAQRDDPAISRAVEEGIPVVTVNRKVDDPAVSSVTNDEDRGVRLAVRHMVELGHRRIAHVAGPTSLSTGLMRFEAFGRALAEAGLPHDPALIAFSAAFNEGEGARCTEALLAAGHGFSAIVCANDRLAIGAIEALRAAGRRCPDDVSVSGHNDMPFADRITPPLTTVRIQKREAGIQAAAILIAQLATPPDARSAVHVTLPVELVVRASTAAPMRPASAASRHSRWAGSRPESG
jgi:LacI family transcriptional regulator